MSMIAIIEYYPHFRQHFQCCLMCLGCNISALRSSDGHLKSLGNPKICKLCICPSQHTLDESSTVGVFEHCNQRFLGHRSSNQTWTKTLWPHLNGSKDQGPVHSLQDCLSKCQMDKVLPLWQNTGQHSLFLSHTGLFPSFGSYDSRSLLLSGLRGSGSGQRTLDYWRQLHLRIRLIVFDHFTYTITMIKWHRNKSSTFHADK